MASRTLPGLGLNGFWVLHEDNWNTGMDANLLLLSSLTQLSVKSRVTVLPGSPTNGDIYIVPSGGNANKIAIRDNSLWTYITPLEGWRAWVQDEDLIVSYSGSAWILSTGTPSFSAPEASKFLRVKADYSGMEWVNLPAQLPNYGVPEANKVLKVDGAGALTWGVDLNSGVSIIAKDEGSTVYTGVTTFNFTGAGVVASTPSAGIIDITIAGAGSGPSGPTPKLIETSTSSNTLGTSGTKTFTYTSDPDLVWVVGQRLRAVNDTTHYMEGIITAVSVTSVSITADYAIGSGTFTSWTLALAGDRGADFPAMTIISKTAAYTFVSGDFSGNKLIEATSASAFTLTLNTGLTGTEPILIAQGGAGQITIAGSATLKNRNGLTTAGLDAIITIIPMGSNVYRVAGDTSV